MVTTLKLIKRHVTEGNLPKLTILVSFLVYYYLLGGKILFKASYDLISYIVMQLLKVQVKTIKPNLVVRKVIEQLLDGVVVVFLELYSGPAHTISKLTRPLINKTFLNALVNFSLYNNK